MKRFVGVLSLLVIAGMLVSACGKKNNPRPTLVVGQKKEDKKGIAPKANPGAAAKYVRSELGTISVNQSSGALFDYFKRVDTDEPNAIALFDTHNCFKHVRWSPPAGATGKAYEGVEVFNKGCALNPVATDRIVELYIDAGKLYTYGDQVFTFDWYVGIVDVSSSSKVINDLCADSVVRAGQTYSTIQTCNYELPDEFKRIQSGSWLIYD